MQKQVVLKISGEVQGVSFRGLSRRKARELNLTGWIRNEPDGTVRIVAEGQEGDLIKLIEWCENSPDYIKVDRVDIEWSNSANQFNDFTIT